MTVLVTGGLGFLGRAVTAALRAAGHDVTVLDNAFRTVHGVETAGASRVIEADVRDAPAVRNACRGVDVVLHLAAIQGTANFYEIPDVVLDVNLRGVLNVAEACAHEGVRRLVFSSSSEVYGVPDVFPTPEDSPLCIPDPWNPRYSYAASKVAGELVVLNYARRFTFDAVVLRYHNVYGPGMGWDHVIPQFIKRLERGEEFTVQGNGEQTRSFCYVDDAVAATVAATTAAGAAGEILNVGNPDEEYTINELVRLLAAVSGKHIVPRYVPFAGEGTRRRVPDIARARRVLGFRPTVPLDRGLERTYAWYAGVLAREHAGAVDYPQAQ